MTTQPVRAYPTMRTMNALEVLAARPLSNPRLADELQVHVRTARSITRRLEVDGYLTRREHRLFVAPQLRELAERLIAAAPPLDAESAAAPEPDAQPQARTTSPS